jgi:methionine-S-sulfoxide reductase
MRARKTETATFAAGCFWHVQEAFERVNGVVKTTVGYTGGTVKNPTYEQVCSGTTGHAEAVRIEYDPVAVSYERLLSAFWRMHDPTTPNRQGPDVGAQYRSAIFFHSAKQEGAARKSKAALESSGAYEKHVVTQIVKASEFYPAEEYHQHYYGKGGAEAANRGCPIR